MVLAEAGFEVEIVEMRDDEEWTPEDDGGLAKAASATKRSINLALSHRGLCALGRVGLAETVLAQSVAMHSRFLHLADGSTATQAYGGPGDAIYSVSRSRVVSILSAEAARRGVRFRRDKLVGLDDDDAAVFASGARGQAPIFGCDGAFSATRRAMERRGRHDSRVWYASQGYKELGMPAKEGGDYAFPPNYLHIWPRGDLMLTALPNNDGSFTATLFAPFDRIEALEKASRDDVRIFFEDFFPDALGAMPEAVDDFFQNPTAPLVQVQLNPWHRGDAVLCLGDASHAVVPFYGQGMNAAFEDCLVLGEIFDRQGGALDLRAAFEEMSTARRAAADGLSTLAVMNYRDMASNTASSLYRARKVLEGIVSAYLTCWHPLYSMVTFSRLPYDAVLRRHARQEAALTALCAGLVVITVATLLAAFATASRRIYLGLLGGGAAGLRRLL
ncbi:hypothetical protein CTAYLR_001475 [Chrysophaeum taylorii]|uniref:FAD-binding domain-containing protein n=1 Tax=Chrysophaeum taylorii TaxID=2483200 RepID=A0AAD7U9F0_9STRA|nr:hypothetical protein CTAYLR_001475 [Chrysophaeum taylorii]